MIVTAGTFFMALNWNGPAVCCWQKAGKNWGGGGIWDMAFRHPFMPWGPLPHHLFMTTPLLQFISHSLERSLMGHVADSNFACRAGGAPLNKRRKQLFGKSRICPRRRFNQLRAIDMAKKYPHSVSRCVPNWHMKIGQLDPHHSHSPQPPKPSVFTKLKGSEDTSWWDVASSSSDDNRGSVSEKVYELCLIELDTKLSQG